MMLFFRIFNPVSSQNILIRDTGLCADCFSVRNECQIILVSLEADSETIRASDRRTCSTVLPCAVVVTVLNSCKSLILLSNVECAAASHCYSICSLTRIFSVNTLLIESNPVVSCRARAILCEYCIPFGYAAQSLEFERIKERKSCTASIRVLVPVSFIRPFIFIRFKS